MKVIVRVSKSSYMQVRMCIFHAVVLLCLYEFHTWASDYSKGVHVCMDESVLTNEVHVRTYQSRSPYSDTCHCACMFLCIVVMIAWELILNYVLLP